ncbi:MAG TPA: ComEC/Rec2 family competence protein [Terriglobales bacterium]
MRATLWGATLIVLSAVMQIGMALPMAYYFHRATSVGIAANLLAVPMLQLLMPAAVIAVALSYFSLALAKVPALVAALSLRGIVGTIHSLSALRMADTRVANPETWMIALCGLGMLVCVVLMRRSRKASWCGLGLLLASTVCLWTIKPGEVIHRGMLELTAIDVGQGDSLLVISPDGKKLLIDGGGLPVWVHSQMEIGEDVVSPYLWTRGFSRIDAIALTHAHADHMIGFLAVIANFHPRELWLPQNVPQAEIRRLLQRAEQYGTRVIYHRAGDVLSFGRANVRVLAPDPRFPVRSGKRNDESLIMKISYGETAMLLEADAEKGTERLISSEAPEADVLKVAHHGSASATNTDFLQRVRPRYAVISVGARNVYRHPRPEVLQRLQHASVRTYRTDRNGATTFLLDGKSVTSLTNLR